jgi:diguanylate cyclase (GGDEF)-like protein
VVSDQRPNDSRSSNDDVTGKQLTLLIGLVVVVGAGVVGWAIVSAVRSPGDTPAPLLLLSLVIAIGIAARTTVWIRIRANRRGISWPEVGVIVGLTVAPVHWVILCTVVAVAASKISNRMPLQKTVYGIAKETLVATTAGIVFLVNDVHFNPNHPMLHPGLIAVAFVAMWIVDESLIVPVIALATRTGLGQMMRTNWDLRVLAMIARYVVTVLVIGIPDLSGDTSLLLIVPPIVLAVHLWQTNRFRSREERRSWQRLAQSTDELNVVELEAVLRSAVVRAADLFSADEAEIELHGGDTDRLVCGSSAGFTYDGSVTGAPTRSGSVITAELQGHEGKRPVGELRLLFRDEVTLTDPEHYKLRTFASALYTAIRNATAYAELERIARENAHAAMHDPLTGLVNRRALLDHGGAVLDGPRGDGMTALLLIDLNHFKEVNDTLGHTAGDLVLCEVAARLRDGARPGELVARLGGDEFAILLTGLPTPAMAQHRAESLLTCFNRTIEVDGMHLTVEASGGIAVAPGTGGVTELLRRADIAMYQAKRSGQRTAIYVPARDTADLGLLVLGQDLSRAVAEDEFIVDFQPIVDLGSGDVVSAEALARWHHPRHGNLNPMRFLEAVERSGKLPAFAGAVLEQSLTAVAAWREAGFDLPVAVNVSPRSLLDPQFPGSVLDRLTRHAVPADRLVLELTETLTISQLEVVDRALGELRTAGVRLALDEFGTGVSSLALLSRIQVHELKIDREFVRAVDTSAEATAVIRSTVDLARSLHLTVVAEGVESEPQRHSLWDLGCVAGQGQLFARPMPAERLLATLRRGTGGRPGTLASALHDAGSVVRLPRRGRAAGRGRSSLPHLPA